MTKRTLKNRAFLAAIGTGLFSQMATAAANTYFSSYMYIIKDWSNYAWTVFLGTITLTFSVFSPVNDLFYAKFHRYKTIVVLGTVIKLVCHAICFDSHNRSTQSTAALAISQILLGGGGSALIVIWARVGSPGFRNLKTIIATFSLWSYLGSSIGYVFSSTIWTDKMLKYMREECPPGTSEKTLQHIYGSIKILHADYDWSDPIWKGAIRAYTRINGIIFIVATVLASLPVIFIIVYAEYVSFPFLCETMGQLGLIYLLLDYYLGKQPLDGKEVNVPARDDDENGRKPGLWNAMKHAYTK